MSHVTGGGLANNLARVMPDVGARCGSIGPAGHPPAIFDLVAAAGRVSRADLEATLNLGVGMVALVPPDAVDAALRPWPTEGCRPGSAAMPQPAGSGAR